MNKTAIKNFAVWARRKLISDITYKAGMIGITENGIAEPLPQSTGDMQFFDIGTKNYTEISGIEIKQRNALVSAIRSKERSSNYKTAFQNVIEEVAYTWFNRLIAVRFMEVNDYLPSRVRVLSSENPAKNEPDFVTNPFDTDLEFTPYEQDRVLQLKDENKLDELFRMLFIKQCNKFNEILPELFEKTDDYSELLLTISFTDKDGVVYHLVHDIDENDFNVEKEGQVEIIGWMYQFYNTEPKEDVFAQLKKNVKISKDKIPAATQIFTPDWIVRYMVENSLGRLWTEGHPNNNLTTNWRYYISNEAQVESSQSMYCEIRPEEIKVIDPCMGSGHILVYAFDVLMQIYESCGYSAKDAAKSILKNNLYGTDIDDRAYQLAYFSVLMKARQYNRRILTDRITPSLCSIQESKTISESAAKRLGSHYKTYKNLESLFTNAKELGSIIKIDVDFNSIHELYNIVVSLCENKSYENIMDMIDFDEIENYVLPIVKQAVVLSQKYDVVVTNPPYMGSKGMSSKLQEYVQYNYPDAKPDLFAVFIEKGFEMIKPHGFNTQVTMQVWMFLTAFDRFREKILNNNHIVSLLHMDNMVMGIAFGTSATVFRKGYFPDYKGKYMYATMRDIGSDDTPIQFPLINERYTSASITGFKRIPRMPIAYWASEKNTEAYSNHLPLSHFADVKKGMSTADDNRFLRLWHEVSNSKMQGFVPFDKAKWYRLCKGGSFRRWYGNNEFVVNWENDGSEMKAFKNAVIRNEPYYFRDRALTWTYVTNYKLNVRYIEKSSFAAVGPCIFTSEDKLMYILAFLNSKVAQSFADNVGGETITYEVGEVASIPTNVDNAVLTEVTKLATENVLAVRKDWDSMETSWDYARHPLVAIAFAQNDKTEIKLSRCFEYWKEDCDSRIALLRTNEERINKIFIDLYELGNELSPTIDDKDISVRNADLKQEICWLLSYAVGCMFGRYSLDTEGLAYAGGVWDSSKYSTFIPDTDNCIPITDEDYFDDDIVGRFVQFIKIVYGENTLEENLDFIAKALGNKGNTSREVIRNYFLNDFIKDHIKMYQKRPIYWMFDSGKQNGFKGLVYMHRWNADTVGNLRVEYLHRMQRVYEKEIERMQEAIDHSQGRDQTTAQKRMEKLVKQLKEAKDYDAKIAHIALARVDIDLDDGVKVNYEKVQKGQDGKNLDVLAKI